MVIPKRSWQRWDGGWKKYASNCDGCDFYRRIGDDELCGYGVAFKYLGRDGKPRKCEIRNIGIGAHDNSIEYLDRIRIVEKTVVIDGVKRKVRIYRIRPQKFKRIKLEPSSDAVHWDSMYQKD